MGSRRTSRSTGPVSKHGKTRKTAVPPEVAESPGYAVSQRLRKRIEEIFGWSKDGRPLRKMRVVGMRNATFMATLTIGCNTLLRVAKLLPAPA